MSTTTTIATTTAKTTVFPPFFIITTPAPTPQPTTLIPESATIKCRRTRIKQTTSTTTITPDATYNPLSEILFVKPYRPRTTTINYATFDHEFRQEKDCQERITAHRYRPSWTPTAFQAETEDQAMDYAFDQGLERPLHCNGTLIATYPHRLILHFGPWTFLPDMPKAYAYNVLIKAEGFCCFKVYRHLHFLGPPTLIFPLKAEVAFEKALSIRQCECDDVEPRKMLMWDDPQNSNYTTTPEPKSRSLKNIAETQEGEFNLAHAISQTSRIGQPPKFSDEKPDGGIVSSAIRN